MQDCQLAFQLHAATLGGASLFSFSVVIKITRQMYLNGFGCLQNFNEDLLYLVTIHRTVIIHCLYSFRARAAKTKIMPHIYLLGLSTRKCEWWISFGCSSGIIMNKLITVPETSRVARMPNCVFNVFACPFLTASSLDWLCPCAEACIHITIEFLRQNVRLWPIYGCWPAIPFRYSALCGWLRYNVTTVTSSSAH